MADKVYLDNSEATEAWNTILFDRFRDYRHIFVTGLAQFSDAALSMHPPQVGDRCIDIGCGFGDTTRELAAIAGPTGHATGLDAAERFIEASREESAGVANVDFVVADAEREVPGGPYDYVFARMGTMFFANPVAAMRNVHAAMKPCGRLCMIVWRRKLDNEWMYRSEEVVDRHVDKPDPEESDELTCGPGPFSMANADTTSDVLRAAGFGAIAFHRLDRSFAIGSDIDELIEGAFALGPAAETMRLAGEDGARLRPLIEADLREIAVDYEQPDGSYAAPYSAWVVTASS